MRTTDRHDREDARRAFEAIARYTLANGGGTFRRETGAPVTLTTGYTVGVGNVAQVGIGWEPTVEAVSERLAYFWPTTAPANAQYVGTWTDDGILYIDHVTAINDRSIALSLARRNGERAVWDNARGVCIDVAEALAPVFVTDAPDGSVVWKHGAPFCYRCGAPLSESGSVHYSEEYGASFGQSSFGECVEYDWNTIESSATCAKCGAPFAYQDVSEG